MVFAPGCESRSGARSHRASRHALRSGERDPEMAWFNDYLFAGEALARLGIVYRFEPDTAQFLE
jgi:hypothetical protein